MFFLKNPICFTFHHPFIPSLSTASSASPYLLFKKKTKHHWLICYFIPFLIPSKMDLKKIVRSSVIQEFLPWLSGSQTRLVSMRMRVRSPASCSGLRIPRCHELWCRPAGVALIQPLAWELPYAASAALKNQPTNQSSMIHNRPKWETTQISINW